MKLILEQSTRWQIIFLGTYLHGCLKTNLSSSCQSHPYLLVFSGTSCLLLQSLQQKSYVKTQFCTTPWRQKRIWGQGLLQNHFQNSSNIWGPPALQAWERKRKTGRLASASKRRARAPYHISDLMLANIISADNAGKMNKVPALNAAASNFQ